MVNVTKRRAQRLWASAWYGGTYLGKDPINLHERDGFPGQVVGWMAALALELQAVWVQLPDRILRCSQDLSCDSALLGAARAGRFSLRFNIVFCIVKCKIFACDGKIIDRSSIRFKLYKILEKALMAGLSSKGEGYSNCITVGYFWKLGWVLQILEAIWKTFNLCPITPLENLNSGAIHGSFWFGQNNWILMPNCINCAKLYMTRLKIQ